MSARLLVQHTSGHDSNIGPVKEGLGSETLFLHWSLRGDLFVTASNSMSTNT